jgi:large subunit ribosomal protein L18
MHTPIDRPAVRRRVRYRIRRRVRGTAQRPRLAVFRSARHLYVQAIDDAAGRTVASSCTRDPEVRSQIRHGGNVAAARVVGEVIAKKLAQAGIQELVFDRGGYLYHGRVRALADAVRSGGLRF